MKCDFCGKNIPAGDKFCANCGAKVKTEASSTASTVESTVNKKEKKHMSAGKIILIVFLCAALLTTFIFGILFLIFRAVTKNISVDDVISGIERIEDFDFDEFDDYDFDTDDDDEIDKWFSQYFDDEDDDKTVSPEREYKGRYDDYKGIDSFISGTIDKKTGAYKSEFGNLEFQLPTSWDVYNEADLTKLYNDEGASKTLANNKLYVYDFYADDTLTGNSMYVKFYNKDYFSEYKDLDAINEAIKDSTYDFAKSYKVDYADDSTITINGDKYDQLACRISGNDALCYQYDFTRDLGDYYMHINIFAFDLDDVGEIIDILNSEG